MSTVNAATQVPLRIMATSDVHGHFTSFNYFSQQIENKGFVQLSRTINEAREEIHNTLLIENGDLIQGNPVTDWMVAQHQSGSPLPLAQWLNQLGYDAANLGNHEFNYGLSYLAAAYEGVNFPILSANLISHSDYARQHLKHQAFALLNKQMTLADGAKKPLSIGLVGVLPPQIMQWDAHHLSAHVTVKPMLEAAAQAIQQVKQAGADIVLLVAHTGMPKHSARGEDAEQGIWQLAQLEHIDGIIFGHQHEVFPGTDVYNQLLAVDSDNGTIFGVPAVQPGMHGEYLGLIDFQLSYENEQWQIISAQSSVRKVSASPEESTQTPFQVVHEQVLDFVRQPIGRTQQQLSLELARLQPTLAMQLIHDAQLWYVQRYIEQTQPVWQTLPVVSAAAPFHAATTAADSFTLIPRGEITLGHIGDLYRYPNTLDVLKVTGAQLKLWLEQSALALQPAAPGNTDKWALINTQVPSYQFDSFHGIRYQIDPTQPFGQRVKLASPLADDAEIIVVTNNYRANGGGDFAQLDGSQVIYRSPDQIQHILLEFIGQLGAEGYNEELDEQWQIIKP